MGIYVITEVKPRLSGKRPTLEGSPKINRSSTHIFCHGYGTTVTGPLSSCDAFRVHLDELITRK